MLVCSLGCSKVSLLEKEEKQSVVRRMFFPKKDRENVASSLFLVIFVASRQGEELEQWVIANFTWYLLNREVLAYFLTEPINHIA